VAPLVRLGKLKVVRGQDDVELLTRRIRTSSGNYRACYERALSKNERLEGRLEVRFEVQPDGSLTNIERVSSTMDDPAMIACVLKAFESVAVEARERSTLVVEAPLVFATVY
jgi:outer membrane biosynthesis protein TonB